MRLTYSSRLAIAWIVTVRVGRIEIVIEQTFSFIGKISVHLAQAILGTKITAHC